MLSVNQLQRVFEYEGQQKITTYDNAGVGEVRLISKDGVPQHIVIQGVTFDRFGLLAAAVRAGSSDNKAAWEKGIVLLYTPFICGIPDKDYDLIPKTLRRNSKAFVLIIG